MSTENPKLKSEGPRTTETPNPEGPRIDANPFTSFDPMTFWAASQQGLHKMVTDAVARAHSFAEQYATLEAQMVSRAQGAIASWAQLTQEAIAYGAQLSAEARKLSVDATRKMSS